KKASIGIHNLDAIKFPVEYTVTDSRFSFVPLGGQSGMMTVEDILKETETGRSYGHLLAGAGDKYPVIVDSAGTVLSLPPIVNGEATRVDTKCTNLFVEVTAMDARAAQDALAVMAITLHDAGFAICPVAITSSEGGRKKATITPDIRPAQMQVDAGYVNDMLGLALPAKEMVACLRRSRLEARAAGKKITCTVPRYRIDITHPIDLVEEVAIGYGIYNIEPAFPPSPVAGGRLALSWY
ncbi:MAG: phenylalanine--tRNA ligase subunit beta, partial [Nitrososphaera sp.]